MDKKALKRSIGLRILLICCCLSLISMVFINKKEFYRLFICITMVTFSLGIRAAFDPEISKDANSTRELDAREVKTAYWYSFLMLLMVSGFIYLSFHQLFNTINTGLFFILASIIFLSMGFLAANVIAKFRL